MDMIEKHCVVQGLCPRGSDYPANRPYTLPTEEKTTEVRSKQKVAVTNRYTTVF
jgi:hypothetical protein